MHHADDGLGNTEQVRQRRQPRPVHFLFPLRLLFHCSPHEDAAESAVFSSWVKFSTTRSRTVSQSGGRLLVCNKLSISLVSGTCSPAPTTDAVSPPAALASTATSGQGQPI